MQNITIFVFNNIVGYPDFQLVRPFVFINIVGYPFIFLCAGGRGCTLAGQDGWDGKLLPICRNVAMLPDDGIIQPEATINFR